MRQRRNIGTPRKAQKGNALVSAMFGLVIASIVAKGTIEAQRTEMQVSAGRRQGDLVAKIKAAADRYASEHYAALQLNTPITRNGTTLAAGATVGQTMSPRVEDLAALGYLTGGTSTALIGNGGSYQIRFRREPTGCVGTACEIPGLLYIDRAIQRSGTTEMNSTVSGAFIRSVGGDAMVSINSAPTLLVGQDGDTEPNPVAATPAGVVGVRVGYGAVGFGNFLTLNDPRDPNFQGDVTVAGDITGTSVSARSVIASTSVGVGTGTTGCRLGEILASGQIISRAANCVNRAWLDPSNGTVNVADAAGVAAVTIDGANRALRVNNGSGVTQVQLDGSTGRAGFNGYAPSSVPAGWTGGISAQDVVARGNLGVWDGTRVRVKIDSTGDVSAYDSTGTKRAGIEISGGANRITGDSVRPSGTGAVGQACGAGKLVGDIAQNAAGAGLVVCDGTKWVQGSALNGEAGAACSIEGSVGVSDAGISMVCTNTKWVPLVERLGKRVFVASYLVSSGTDVQKPLCASGTTGSLIFLLPMNEDTNGGYVNRYAQDNGANWRVFVQDGQNTTIAAQLIAMVYCAY